MNHKLKSQLVLDWTMKRLGLNHKLIHIQSESQTDSDLFAYSSEKFTEKNRLKRNR